MENPWGLTGPEFVQLYAVGLAVALVLTGWIRIAGRRPDPQAGTQVGALTEVELGFLIGGARRAVQTAVAAMLARNALRASRGGYVSGTGAVRLSDPLERAVHDYTGETGRRTLTVLVDQVAEGRAATEVGARLADRGLLVPAERLPGTGLRSAVPLVALGLFGLWRVFEGAGRGFPVGYLGLLVALTAVLAGFAAWLPVAWRTQAGDLAVERALRSTSDSAAGSVARDGIPAYPEAGVRAALLSHSAQPQLDKAAARSRRRRVGGHHNNHLSAGYVGGFDGGGSVGCGGGGGSSSGGGGCGGGSSG